jgi:hypothetical protein
VTRLCNELDELRKRNLVLEERELAALEGMRAPPLATGRGLVRGRGQGQGQGLRRSAGSVMAMMAALGGEPASQGGAGAGAGVLLRASHPLPSHSPSKGRPSSSGLGSLLDAGASADTDAATDAAMGAAEHALFQASLRGAHASSKLRRLAQENVALRGTVEALRRGERQALVQERMHEHTRSKLRAAHAECTGLQQRCV